MMTYRKSIRFLLAMTLVVLLRSAFLALVIFKAVIILVTSTLNPKP